MQKVGKEVWLTFSTSHHLVKTIYNLKGGLNRWGLAQSRLMFLQGDYDMAVMSKLSATQVPYDDVNLPQSKAVH